MSSAYNPADDLEGIVETSKGHHARCNASLSDGIWTPYNGFGFPPEAPTLWVKFDIDVPTLINESKMQTFVSDSLSSLALDNCHVPRVHRFHIEKELFDKADGNIYEAPEEDFPYGFMVTDYCKGTMLCSLSIHEDSHFQVVLARRIAQFLTALTTLRPPLETSPGNAGDMSSLIWGFDEFFAPRAFETVEALQNYINNFIQDVSDTATADFSREPLCLCYGDFNLGNFMLEDPTDPHSGLTAVEFDRTNWLPVSFLWWEVMRRDRRDGPFFKRVAEAVRALIDEPPNLDNVYAINCFHWKRGQEELKESVVQ